MTNLELAKAEWWYANGKGTAPNNRKQRELHGDRMWFFLLMAAEDGELDAWYCPLCGRASDGQPA